MGAVQRIVRLGHAARNAHGLKTRQPLASATLVAADPELPALVEPYADLVTDELNVHAIRWAEERSDYVHHEVKPVYPKTGPRFGKRMKEVAAALAAADGDALAEALEREGKVTIELADGPVELTAEELEVRIVEREGTAAQGDRELLVALDTALTPELVAEGLAREVVNRIQTARKDADLDYADRIRVRYRAGGELARAIEDHRDWIAGETLAVELDGGATGGGLRDAPVEDHDFAFTMETV
jgi:isoleucyl-tRNA synthetase